MDREVAEKVQALLDDDAPELTESERESVERQFGPFPSATRDRLRNLLADYDDLRQQVSLATEGVLFPGDAAKAALLDKERRADLARLLTSEQLEAYDPRTSRTIGSLRS